MSEWSREEDKAFEDAIALHWVEDSKEVWDKISSLLPTRSPQEIKRHYQVLVDDVTAIEAGHVELPDYASDDPASPSPKKRGGSHPSEKRSSSTCGFGNGFPGPGGQDGGGGGKAGSQSDQERRKGIPWTEDEHRLFLLGLDKFGKGDWRSISRNFVVSRTPTQVASHAQKYFIRLNSMNRDRRRSSIHDITSVTNGDAAAAQTPITGQQGNAVSPPSVAATGPSLKVRPPAHMPGVGMYGAPVGHPVAAPPGHLASAIGTPVMLPPPGHHPHPPYVVPVAYPVPPPPPPPPMPQ
ncbi:hypothetical protein MLD38_032823 [Melastoma candidum]|uniref:Uncharacterized protein n=1 Tax=Melastoma candidum TaxID=119954 RepID=A0ACB9M571_9MYRT|nr:hypothetical protein MLD38_032823 [Melastoma candidum]